MNKPDPSTLISKVDREDEKPGHLMNFVDRLVTFVNPTSGLHRMFARQQLTNFGFDDKPGQRRKTPPLRGPETWDKNRDRLKVMADARDLVTYDWIGGVIARVVLYVCGRIHCKSELGDDSLSAAYDEYFHNWCGDDTAEDGTTNCDITGRHRLIKIVQMAFAAFLVDGDHGIVEVDPMFSPTGAYCLQSIEADRIGSPMDANSDPNYIGGVFVSPNGSGRIEGFNIFELSRTGQYGNPQVIDPSGFIHVADLDRPGEYRGRSKLMRLIKDAKDIQEWINAEKIAGKTQSQWAAMIGTKDPTAKTGLGAWDGRTPDGTPSQDAIWGKILKMAEGENFAMLSPSARPSGAFMAFVEMLIRKMAASLNLPYGFLWDLASLGGVTARIEVQGALRQIQYWQDNIIVAKILNRVRQKVIAEAIALNVLPAHPNWKKCSWYFGPWIVTDAGYDMQSDVAGVTTGIMPIADVTAKYGKSPREVFQSNAEAANTAITVGQEMMLPVEAFAPGLYPNLSEQKAAITTPPPPPPAPGSLEAIGEKGFAEMAKLLQAVKKGDMDHKSCVATLVTVFNLPDDVAEEITPPNATKAELKLKNPAPAGGGGMKTSQSSKSKPAAKKKK